MQTITRHYHYYIVRSKAELMQFWEYRIDMLTTSMGTFGYTIMTLIFIDVVFNQTQAIAGWTQPEVLVLFGFGQLLFYTQMALFGATYSRISETITTGEFDRNLLKPLSAVFSSTTERSEWIRLIPSYLIPIAIFSHAFSQLQIQVGFNTGLAIISLVLSLIIYFCLYFLVAISAFWWTDTSEISGLFHRLDELQNFPSSIYPSSIKWFFFLVFPIGIVAYAPATFLIHGFQLDLFIYQITALVLFVTLTRILWIRGLRNYSSASS